MDDLTAAAAADAAAAREAKKRGKKKGWAKEALKKSKQEAESKTQSKSVPATRGGTVPWFIIFILCVYLCIKLMALYESPCAILGIQNPASKRSVARAYRTLSKCTHPDRLVKFGPDAQHRGEVLFRRIVDAKADITSVLQHEHAKNVSCYTGGGAFAFEASMLQMLKDSVATSDGREFTGAMLQSIGQYLFEVVTFEHGFVAVAILGLTLMTITRHCCALRREASQQSCTGLLLRIPMIFLIGPLEVTFRLLVVPIVRWGVFFDTTVQSATQRSEEHANEAGKDDKKPQQPVRSSAGLAAANSGSVGPRRRAGRSKKETAAQRKDRETGAVVGSSNAAQVQLDEAKALVLKMIEDKDALQRKRQMGGRCAKLFHRLSSFPFLRGVRELHRSVSSEAVQLDVTKLPPGVKLTNNSLSQGDDFAAGAVQNDFVLSITKPIIPLALLITTGENMSGFWSSLVIMSFLQRIPKMRAANLHLALFFFGVVHTFLEASAVRRVETSAGDTQVVLKWQWGLSDVLLASNLVLMGSTFAAVSRNGNGPGMLSSFASGVAVRILASMVTPASLAHLAHTAWESLFPADDMLVQFQPSSEVSSWAGGGVGDCGGGPLQMFFSQGASVVDIVLRGFLLVMPVLHAAEWGITAYRSMTSGKRRGRVARGARNCLFTFGALAQCFIVLKVSLNGLNGSLIGFFVVLVFATHVESLLNTYDVRGSVRQVLNYLLFIFI